MLSLLLLGLVLVLGVLLGLDLVHNPSDAFLQALASLGRARLDLPSAVTNAIEAQQVCDLCNSRETTAKTQSNTGGRKRTVYCRGTVLTVLAERAFNKSCLLANTRRGTPASLSSSRSLPSSGPTSVSARFLSALSTTYSCTALCSRGVQREREKASTQTEL